MLTRRRLVVAGGLALAGRLLPSAAWRRDADPPHAEIAMRSADGGARVWFDPTGLRVRPGATVRWVLVEGVHTTTAYHPEHGDRPRRIPTDARPWDSGHMTEPGATFDVTLEAEGVHDFYCRPHEAAGMVGRVVVASDAALETFLRGGGRPDGEEWPDDERLPRAAAGAFPSVDEVLRKGTVRGEGA